MSPLPLILESKNFSGSLSPILLQGPGFLLSLFLSEEILLDLQHLGEAVHQGGFSTAFFSSLTRLPPPLSIGFSRSGSQSFVCFNSRVLHICLPFCHPTHTHMLFPCHHTRGSSTQAFCIILQPRIWVNKEAFPLHFPPVLTDSLRLLGSLLAAGSSWSLCSSILSSLCTNNQRSLCAKCNLGLTSPCWKKMRKKYRGCVRQTCSLSSLIFCVDVQLSREGVGPSQNRLGSHMSLGLATSLSRVTHGVMVTLQHCMAKQTLFALAVSQEPGWGRGVPAWDNVWWQPGLTVMCLTHVTDQPQMCEKCCSPHHQKIHLQQPDGAVRPWMITNCTSIWFRLRSTQAWDLPWAHLSPVKPGRLL